MFPNEVLVEKADKERLEKLLAEADEILDKYPYDNGVQSNTVTTISRAKEYVRNARQWCGYLHTKAD